MTGAGAAYILLSVLGGVLEAAILTMLAEFAFTTFNLDSAQGSHSFLDLYSLPLPVLIVSAILLRVFGAVASVILVSKLESDVLIALRTKVTHRFLGSSWISQSGWDAGQMQQLAVGIPNSVANSTVGLLAQLGNITIALAMVFFALFRSFLSTLALASVIFGLSIFFVPLRRKIKSSSSRRLGMQSSVAGDAVLLGQIREELFYFGVQDKFRARLSSKIKEEAKAGRRISILKGLVVPIYTTFSYGAILLSLTTLSRVNTPDVESVGATLLIVLRAFSYGQSIQQIGVLWANLGPSIDLMKDQLKALTPVRAFGSSHRRERFNSLSLEGVTFCYPDGSRGIEIEYLELHHGERLGISGRSGSGKSSLVKLLSGLVAPDTGDVRLNGVSSSLASASWKTSLGVVPQETRLVAGSIRDNIQFFREPESDAHIWMCLERANLAEVVIRLPEGLGTILDTNAWVPSGGQGRRLTIARALFSEPEVLLLDEPTVGLEDHGVKAVIDTLHNLSGQYTVVVVSHDRRVLAACQRIIYVEGGEIVEGVENPDPFDS